MSTAKLKRRLLDLTDGELDAKEDELQAEQKLAHSRGEETSVIDRELHAVRELKRERAKAAKDRKNGKPVTAKVKVRKGTPQYKRKHGLGNSQRKWRRE